MNEAARPAASSDAIGSTQPGPTRSWSDQNGSSMSVSVMADVVRKRSKGIATTRRPDATAAAAATARGRGASRSTHATSAMQRRGAT
jgi:hypothetical protein